MIGSKKYQVILIKVVFALSIVIIINSNLNSQSYNQSTTTYSWDDISGSGTNVTTTSCDDCYYTGLPIGFTFNYFGNNYSTCMVSTEGWLSFSSYSSSYYSNVCLPNSADPNNIIAAYWDDNWFDYSCSPTYFKYQTLGTSPNRRFVVSWIAFVNTSGSCGSYVYTQIKLFETSNIIEVHLQSNATGSGGTIGIENSTGTVGYQAICNSATTNGTAWRWTPCTPGSISGAPATICTGSNITYTWSGTGSFTNFQYQWDGTGGSWTDWGATNPYTWTSSWAGHTLYVRAKISGGGCYSPAVSTLVLDNVVSPGSISPSELSICSGSSVTLNSTVNSSALGSPTLYIKWYRWDGSGWTFIVQNNSQTLTDTPPGAGTYTYLRRTWTSCGAECSPACYDATTTITVTTASTAATSITASPNPVCSGNSTTMSITGGSLGTGANWVWGVGSCGPVYNEPWGANWPTYWKGSTTENSYIVGIVNITSTTNDPMIGMESVGSFDPSIYKYIQIRYRVVSGTAGNAEIFYTNDRSAVAVGDQMVSGALISDGAWHSLVIDMSVGTYWNGYGNIRGWRYDWCTNSGVTMELDNISLAAGFGTSPSFSPTAATTYYVRAEGVCNTTACVNTAVSITTTLPATPNAGEDQYICGTNTTMAASGSGTWSQISGPNTPNIVNASLSNTQIGTITGFITGTYVFRWAASNACGTSYDDVVIIKQ